MVISLLIHALFIYLIPKLRPIEHEERIGSYTHVQLIHSSLSPLTAKRPGNRPLQQAQKPAPAQQQAQKTSALQPQVKPVQPHVKKAAPAQQEAKKSVPVPEMDASVLARMKTARDVPMPSFDLPKTQQRDIQPLPHPDAASKDESLDRDLEDEVIAEQKRSPAALKTPQPQPRESASKSQEQQPTPEPVPDEADFDQESPEEKNSQTGSPSLTSDIEWQGKPRRIVKMPDHPPRYPEGYQGQTQGRIRLKFWVDDQGYVIRVIPMQKLDPRLDAVATDYLRQYRFEPTMSAAKGAGLEWGIIPFTFYLK